MKWFLNVRMARSALLALWFWGETNCTVTGIGCERKRVVSSSDFSLSVVRCVMVLFLSLKNLSVALNDLT